MTISNSDFSADNALFTIRQICAASEFIEPFFQPPLRRGLELGHKRLEIVAGRFKELGYSIFFQKFLYKKQSAVNMVAKNRLQNGPIVLFCGHHDYCVGLGAEDNASALAVMLELARCLKDNHPNLAFASFDLEEKGLVGSRHFVSSLKSKDIAEISAVIALECLGTGKNPIVCANVDGAQSDNGLVQAILRSAEKAGHPFLQQGFDWFRSDHVPFAKRGVKTVEICSMSLGDYRQFIRRHDPCDLVPNRTFNLAHTEHDLPKNIRSDAIQAVGETMLQFIQDLKV